VGLAVVDASVLIAFFERSDLHHRNAVRALDLLRRRHDIVLPAVAYAEVMTGALRAGPEAVGVVQGFVDAAATIAPLTPEIAMAAARLRAERGLRLPDASIIATGIALEAAVILTADFITPIVDDPVAYGAIAATNAVSQVLEELSVESLRRWKAKYQLPMTESELGFRTAETPRVRAAAGTRTRR